MQIGVVDLNTAMSSSQELMNLRHAEEHRGVLNQSVFQNVVDKKNEDKASQVNGATDVDARQQQKDASDKGSNEYAGDGGARRGKRDKEKEKKDEIPIEGRVVRKSHLHFESGI